MALAHQGRAIAAVAQQFGIGGVQMPQCEAVVAHTMQRGHAPGHERGAVGHADGRGHVKAFEPHAALRERIDVRGLQHRVAVATEKIGTVLVGDEEDEIAAQRGIEAFAELSRLQMWKEKARESVKDPNNVPIDVWSATDADQSKYSVRLVDGKFDKVEERVTRGVIFLKELMVQSTQRSRLFLLEGEIVTVHRSKLWKSF